MLRRFARDESGMTMGLVVVMIVLIGVMGAGLLTFVQRDLQSVIEVNRGQKSIEVTDAGIQAAKRQILINSRPNQYNAAALTPEAVNSEWAFDSASAACGTLPSGPGKCITTTTEGDVRVTIRYLPPPTNLLGVGTGSRTDSNFAPEDPPAIGQDYPDKRDYFRVEADGVFSGSRRKVRAIMVTEDIGLPKAYFASRNIELKGNATGIYNVSLFARGYVSGVRPALFNNPLDPNNTDVAYGNWQNAYNDKPRSASGAFTNTSVGVAAEGRILGAEEGIEYFGGTENRTQKLNPTTTLDRYKRLDFDAITSTSDISGASGSDTVASPSPNYYFCDRGNATTPCNWLAGSSQPASVITYPFSDSEKLDAAFMQSIAEQQVDPVTLNDNYEERPGGGPSFVVDEDNFYQTTPNKLNSVYVVRFTGGAPGKVVLSPDTTGFSPPSSLANPCPLGGTIVVINGSVDTSSSGDKCFDGIVSVQDPNNLGTLVYENLGTFTLNGFTNVEGTMKIGGSVNPILGQDVLNNPGYHNVKIWSWRECYNTTCS